MILYGGLRGQRLAYTLLFLAEAALLGEVDLLFTAGAVLTLVGEAAFDIVAALALAGVDFDGVAGSFLVAEGATRAFFGLSRIGLEFFDMRHKLNEITS
jgi:hypothetical protein